MNSKPKWWRQPKLVITRPPWQTVASLKRRVAKIVANREFKLLRLARPLPHLPEISIKAASCKRLQRVHQTTTCQRKQLKTITLHQYWLRVVAVSLRWNRSLLILATKWVSLAPAKHQMIIKASPRCPINCNILRFSPLLMSIQLISNLLTRQTPVVKHNRHQTHNNSLHWSYR